MKSIIAVLLLSASLHADTLILRDGRRIEGQLIGFQNGTIAFEDARQFGGGRVVQINRDDVRSIEFDRSDARSITNGRPSGLRERQIMVPANVRSIDTNVEVRAGQDVYFESNGEIVWGPGRRDNAGGEQNSPLNPNRPMPNRPAAALIGRVGENSSDYFFIGADRGPIRMRSSGRLFLAVNDDVLQDNSGAFRVVVYY